MRVLCIIDGKWGREILNRFFNRVIRIEVSDGPKWGNIDEVVEQVECEGNIYYVLQNWPGCAYDSKQFIPVSEIDETTFNREMIRLPNKLWPVDKSLK